MFTVDHPSPYLVEIPDVLSQQECAELIDRIERLGPETATINTSQGVQVRSDVRNNDRVIFDDHELANKLFERVQGRAPREMRGRLLTAANERFRCYRYKPGMRFAPHADGSFERNEFEKSFYTYLVYLNDDFDGGETTVFMKRELLIKPRAGWGLLFQHPIIHEGCVVKSGVKYVARTDLMYRCDDSTMP